MELPVHVGATLVEIDTPPLIGLAPNTTSIDGTFQQLLGVPSFAFVTHSGR